MHTHFENYAATGRGPERMTNPSRMRGESGGLFQSGRGGSLRSPLPAALRIRAGTPPAEHTVPRLLLLGLSAGSSGSGRGRRQLRPPFFRFGRQLAIGRGSCQPPPAPPPHGPALPSPPPLEVLVGRGRGGG